MAGAERIRLKCCSLSLTHTPFAACCLSDRMAACVIMVFAHVSLSELGLWRETTERKRRRRGKELKLIELHLLSFALRSVKS